MSEVAPALLVVDDNEDNRFTLTERLKREGYGSVACASNGRGGAEALATRSFDLVLLDITMPEMDGYQVLEHLKADTTLRNILVVMISAVDEIDSVARCISLGAEDYLAKPFNAVLLRAVAACLKEEAARPRGGIHAANRKRKAPSGRASYAILPAGAVRELKATNEVRPRRYNEVAVLFCDIVGFTAYCDENPPEKVVEDLQALIGEYERSSVGMGWRRSRLSATPLWLRPACLIPCQIRFLPACDADSPW